MNAFATFALFAWVPLSLWVAKRYRPSIAVPVLLFGATMFLPQQVEVKIPGIVGFDKSTVATLWCAIGVAIAKPAILRRARIRGVALALVALAFVSVAGTALGNTDAFVVGGRGFDGFDLLDLVLGWQDVALRIVLPMLLGVAVFRSRDEVRDLFVVLAGAGIVYSVPMIVEKVLSPQLHRWIYGAHQHEFLQTIRAGGFRPMVFMYHGLAVALFTLAAFLAAVTLHRLGGRVFGYGGRTASLYLGALLVACNSVGSLVYGAFAAPIALARTRRWAIPAAALFTAIALLYPVLAYSDVVPRDRAVEWAARYGNEDRAASLRFRFLNEELCFERGLERPWFGWGGFDRSGVFDPSNGRTLSVRDGHWVIVFGETGAVGYLAQMGLLAYPVLLAFRRRRTLTARPDVAAVEGLAMIAGIHVFDLLLNGLFSYLPYFFSGALLGALLGVEQRRTEARAGRPTSDTGVATR